MENKGGKILDHASKLGEEKIGKLLLKFSIPAIIGMVVNALYNIVDRIFVGHIKEVGSLSLSGITIVFPIMIILMAFGMLIGIGATSLISIRLGEQKKEEAEKILGNAFILLIGITLIISITSLIFLDFILKQFGASDVVFPYAKAYITIILIGSIFQSIGFGMNNFIRAEGNPKVAMLTMLIGAILNTILDPIFIFVFHMGIKGAALATIISQAVSAIWVLSYFFGKRSTLKIHRTNLKLQKEIILKIISIGMAPFSMQIAASVIVVIMNKSLYTYGGDTAIAAMGIINSISMLILMPIFGINQGVQPIIGYNYGARSFERVKTALKLAIMAATTISTIGFIVVMAFPVELIGLFNKRDINLIKIGSHGIRIVLAMLPIIGFQIVSSNYFQAIGKAKHSMFLSLSRQIIFLIPLLLLLPNFFQLNGVWLASPVSDILSSIVAGIFLFRELKRLKLKSEKE